MPEAIQLTLTGFWRVLTEMSPYLLFGFFVAGLLSVVISPEWVERHLGQRGRWPVLKAAAFGVPLPLCSCGVIPVAASLRRHGATRGATTAFLLSTPQTGVDSILVTYSLLGPVFAVFRPIAALLTGLFGGSLVAMFDADNHAAAAETKRCKEACCSDTKAGRWFARSMRYGFVTLARDIAKPLLVGVIAAGLISAIIPRDLFAGKVGSGIGAIFAMMVIGIPIYVCATASIPIAAVLVGTGIISPGAAFAFLVTGPATNAATIATVWKVLGRRTALIYLATVALSAVGMGVLLNHVYTVMDVPGVPSAALHEHSPGVLGTASAVILLGVLAFALFPQRKSEHAPEIQGTAERVTLTVTGMTCEHCVRTVRRALLECRGVETAAVDLKQGRAVVTGTALDERELRRATTELGYGVSEKEQQDG